MVDPREIGWTTPWSSAGLDLSASAPSPEQTMAIDEGLDCPVPAVGARTGVILYGAVVGRDAYEAIPSYSPLFPAWDPFLGTQHGEQPICHHFLHGSTRISTAEWLDHEVSRTAERRLPEPILFNQCLELSGQEGITSSRISTGTGNTSRKTREILLEEMKILAKIFSYCGQRPRSPTGWFALASPDEFCIRHDIRCPCPVIE